MKMKYISPSIYVIDINAESHICVSENMGLYKDETISGANALSKKCINELSSEDDEEIW